MSETRFDDEWNYEFDSDASDEDDDEDDMEDDNDDDDEGQGGGIDASALRIAMRADASPNFIIPLIEAYYMITVQQQQKYDEGGKLLLHLACSKCGASVVMKLIELFPKSVQQTDKHGDYPLHIACTRQSDDVVMKLIQLYPMAVQHQNNDTYYPLHLACVHGRSKLIVTKLLDIFPKAAYHNVLTWSENVKQKGKYGFALHMACRYVHSIDGIRKLIKTNRMALYKKDSKGNYPLHCALYGEQSNGIVMLLLDVDPLAILRLNSKGDSPFHTAYRCMNQTFIENMIEADDAFVNIRNGYGKTLLHYVACNSDDGNNGIRDDIIDMLLQHPCIVVNVGDNNNNTPLHIAARSQNVTMVRKLLDHRFILIDQKNSANKTPLDILKETIKLVEKRKEERIVSVHDDFFETCYKDQLSRCLEIIQLLETFRSKKRRDAYLYHFNAISDM